MAKEDYYEILGVGKTASKDEIASAYRKLAMQYHPDRNPGDEEDVERFKLCAEAFEVLSNEQKRTVYDRYGHAGLDAGGGGGPQFRDIGDIFSAFGDMFGDSLFGQFFGGARGGRGRHAQPGADVRCDISLDLHEAARGISKPITFRRHEACNTCKGTGSKPGVSPQNCKYCGGAGRITQATGFFSIQTTCPQCRGAGAVITDPCRDCSGRGMIPQTVTRDIKIPAGVDNGTRLRLQGEGEKSLSGGPPGDCYVFISVKTHPLFHRDGQNLICRVPIGYAQAVLGAEIEVPTLDGPEKISIPAGTQNNDVITLRGRGMPIPRRSLAGDLLIQVYIEVPRKIKQEHEELLRKLAAIEKEHVMPEHKTFFSKLAAYVSEFFSEGKER